MTATPTQTPPTVTGEPPPRRNWLLLSVAAVLLIVAVGGVGWWIGSSSDDTADVAGEMPEVLEEFSNTLLGSDAVALTALFTEDGGFAGPQEGQIRSDLSPPSIIREAWHWVFAFVDYTEVEHLEVITDANTVVVVSKMDGISGTHQRESLTPFSATVVDAFELRDGLIAQRDTYF